MPRNLFGQAVSRARRAVGLSQLELATRLERSASWIADVERGRTIPSDLDTIVEIAWNLQLDPVEFNSIRIQAQHEAAQCETWNLEEPVFGMMAEIELRDRHRPSDTFARPRSKKSLEDHAEKVAEKLAGDFVDEGYSIPVLRLLELNPNKILRAANVEGTLSFETKSSDSRAEGYASVSKKNRFTIGVSARTADAAREGNGRARFTLAHEIAHVLQHGSILAEKKMFRDRLVTPSVRLAPGMKIFESPEWQANTWASAFLMPKKSLARFLRFEYMNSDEDDIIAAIATRFEVSYQAAQVRLGQVLPRLLREMGDRLASGDVQ